VRFQFWMIIYCYRLACKFSIMQFGAHFGGQSTNDFVMHVYASNVMSCGRTACATKTNHVLTNKKKKKSNIIFLLISICIYF
jgi:hypothetical protein